jgi:glycosyltransferase involved in cell wall biosynthesis
MGLDQEAPLVLFAGSMSSAAGADLFVEALATVARNHRSAQFVLVGDGPLRGELEARAWDAGVGHRCRFLGDLHGDAFEHLLAASDFVVIPARTWQDPGLAQQAMGCGRPVLATHQAGIAGIVHGQNGLVTFDNPGSIAWGIQELLYNPPRGMQRLAAKQEASIRIPSLQVIAARHYLHYAIVSRDARGDKGA